MANEKAYIGRRNRASGELLEKIIIGSCLHYERIGTAFIEKTPEAMRVIRQIGNGRFEAFFTKQAQPDFKGTRKGGGAVVFEAKHTDTGKLSQSVVTPEQSRALERHRQMGAEAFVVVSFGFQNFYKIPWEIFSLMKEHYGRKYITPDDCEKSGFTINYTGGVLKFLTPN